MFGQVPTRSTSEPPIPPADAVRPLDWSARLSIEMIRQHTKTDDVPGVTDDQLKLYRDAAIEAAEFYTGMLLSCQKTVTEPIQGPSSPKPGKTTYRHRLRYPTTDGIIQVYGGRDTMDNRTFVVPPGSTVIRVPIRTGYLDNSNCCDPCSSHHLNGGLMAMYRAGFIDPDKVPAGIVLGCLQFLAWIMEHPGDELLTQRNKLEAKAQGVQGTNNIAVASGALETWRMYDPEAI